MPGSITKNLVSLTGNVVEIYVGGQKIGYASNVQGSDNYNHQVLSGVGDAHPQEHAPGIYQGQIRMDRAVLRKKSILKILNDAAGGDVTDPFTNMDGALQGIVVDIQVNQKSSGGGQGVALRTWLHCTMDTTSFQAGKHAILMSDVTFLPLDVQDDLSGTGIQAIKDMDAST